MNQAVSTWSYRPGEWLAIFGATTTLLLPASEKARAATLWDVVDGGADFDETLDQVLAPGLSVLPAFVLIGTGDGPTKVVVRGDGVRAELRTHNETVDLDGSTVTTWVERTLDGVIALSVHVGGTGQDGPDYLIEGGLVRVARVDHPPYAIPVEGSQAPVESMVEAVVVPLDADPHENTSQDTSQDPGAGTGEQPTDANTDEPPHEPETSMAVFDAAAEEPDTTDIDPLVAPLEVEDEADSQDETIWSDGGLVLPPGPPPTAPPPPPPPVAATAMVPDVVAEPPPPAVDHDGLTRAGAQHDEFARSQPGIPGQPMAPSITRPVAKLIVSGGEAVDVDRVILVGRAPEARRFTATEQPCLITVPSPLHEISSTHVEIRPGSGADHGSAVVTDMGSTNGTVLVQPGLDPEDLKPGIAVQLIPGAVINLGDGVTIQVLNP